MVEIQIRNATIKITYEQSLKVPTFVKFEEWFIPKTLTESPYRRVQCYHNNKRYYLHTFLFDVDLTKQKVIFPNGSLDFTVAYIDRKTRSRKPKIADRNDAAKRQSLKEGVLLNGCLIKSSKQEGERCKYNWRCKHYDSCLDLVAETTVRGWTANGEGYVKAVFEETVWSPTILIEKLLKTRKEQYNV